LVIPFIIMSRKEGYLTKEGLKVKNWKKRWFVLGKETLSYYTNHKSLKKVLGVISLAEIGEVSQTNGKKKDFCLQLVTRRRVYYVVAESKQHMEEWKGMIQQQSAIVQGKAEPQEKEAKSDDEKVNIKSFELLTVIGQGSFGKVVQVRHKETGDIFAMKVLNKKILLIVVKLNIQGQKRIF